MNIFIRPYRPGDLKVLRRTTVEAFDGLSSDQILESKFGLLHGHDWRWRKARHVEDEVNSNAAGAFVAANDDQIVGYITTLLDRAVGKARIPNLSITAAAGG